MSNLYEIDYEVIMRGGKALVSAPSYDEAIGAFYSGVESIKQLEEPTPETTVKNVTKHKG